MTRFRWFIVFLLFLATTINYIVLFAICSTAYIAAFVVNHVLASRFEPVG